MSNEFYVHIVESPAPSELLDGITEGKALCSFLDIAGIPYLYNLVVDLKHFEVAMTHRVYEGIEKFQRVPILHISTHGDQTGIQLTSQYGIEVLSWSELAKYIRPVHELLNPNGGLGVCMSCCFGAYGIRMAEVIRSNSIPFSWIIGASTEIKVPDAALAYSIFYRRHHCGIYDGLMEAVEAGARVQFDIWEGEYIQKEYSKKVRQQNIDKILENVRQRFR